MKIHSVIGRTQKPISCNVKSADAFKDNSGVGSAGEMVDFFGVRFRLAGVETGLWACWPLPPPPFPKGLLYTDQLVSNNS